MVLCEICHGYQPQGPHPAVYCFFTVLLPIAVAGNLGAEDTSGDSRAGVGDHGKEPADIQG